MRCFLPFSIEKSVAARLSRPMKSVFGSAACALLAMTFSVNASAAERELLVPLGHAGTLAIDQISGFRMSSLSGVSYAGTLGLATRSAHIDPITVPTIAVPEITAHETSYWIAPSADYFVSNHF